MRRIKRYLESSDLPLEERTLRIKTECYFLDRRFGKAPVMQVNVEAPMRPVIVDLVTEEDIRKHHAAAREDDDGDYQPRRQPATPEPPVEALDASYEHPGTELESSPNPEPVAAGDSVPAPAPDYTLVRRGSAWEIEQPKKPEPPKSEWELIRG
jgi:hypothetical protein